MNSTKQSAMTAADKHMNTRNLIRWAGISAMVTGIFYVVVGLFHPLETLLSVTTPRWVIVHSLASAMSFFGVLGLTGLYARQAKEAGWLGLAGFLMLSLWLTLQAPFTFAEAMILPLLASESPAFVQGFLGIFSGSTGEMNFGVLPTLWTLTGPLYILGGLLFGIATFRVSILSRWAGGLLAVAAALTPAGALLPHDLKALVAVPVGMALVWLGYALWSERREQASPVSASLQLRQTGAK